MNRIIITAVLAAGFAGAALADPSYSLPDAPFASTRTRADVQAELALYKNTGVNPVPPSADGSSFHYAMPAAGHLTREEVRAGLARGNTRTQTVELYSADGSALSIPQHFGSALKRSDVQAEARQGLRAPRSTDLSLIGLNG